MGSNLHWTTLTITNFYYILLCSTDRVFIYLGRTIHKKNPLKNQQQPNFNRTVLNLRAHKQKQLLSPTISITGPNNNLNYEKFKFQLQHSNNKQFPNINQTQHVCDPSNKTLPKLYHKACNWTSPKNWEQMFIIRLSCLVVSLPGIEIGVGKDL